MKYRPRTYPNWQPCSPPSSSLFPVLLTNIRSRKGLFRGTTGGPGSTLGKYRLINKEDNSRVFFCLLRNSILTQCGNTTNALRQTRTVIRKEVNNPRQKRYFRSGISLALRFTTLMLTNLYSKYCYYNRPICYEQGA